MNAHSLKTITGNGRAAGCIGWPISHSLSPRLHGYWLAHYKIDGAYIPFAVKPEKLEQALRALPALNLHGVNITIPHKEAVLTIVDHLDPVAKRVGAVNMVVVHDDGTLEGSNTDVYGFTQNLMAAGFMPGARPVTLLGAGGAGRAALVALIDMGVGDIRLVNRTRERAEKLAQEVAPGRIKSYDWGDAKALKDSALLVNATSLGMIGKQPLDIALDGLPADAAVNDMVYVPLMTDLLKRAAARGLKTIDGLGMLLHQARPAFAAFFGVDPQVTDELRSFVTSAGE